ncbi:MAG: tryptophan synthase subunit beta [Thermoplasmatota archaeon]
MNGYFGEYGGRWVAETLMPTLLEITEAFEAARTDPAFIQELAAYNQHYGGRPTPLYRCDRLTAHHGGATIWLKREDLVHGGAHKFNNVMGQALLAKRMGKTRIIAETGAGQHGVATAMAGAVLGLPVEVFMGSQDVARQQLNVFRMRLFGAKVHEVPSGNGTLKDAVNQTLREWAADPAAYYCVGSVVGPHPFPFMVREFQKVIGEEIRQQSQKRCGGLPDALVACVGGGSNAMGTFYPFIDTDAQLIGVEAGGDGIETGRHASAFAQGRPGILHGMLSYLFQDEDGQVIEPHSISAGLDYPGVGPEHAALHDAGRVQYQSATDAEALQATKDLCRLEGILPALESAHALARAGDIARELGPGKHVVVNLSGRGDKDVHTLRDALEDP